MTFERPIIFAKLLFLLVPLACAQEIPTNLYSPNQPSPAWCVSQSCSDWLSYRRAHQYPYQATVVKEHGDQVVVMLTEPPPAISRNQLVTGVRALFGNDLRDASFYRWPTGADGWLEDLVFSVHATSKATLQAMDSDLELKEFNAGIVDRLRMLYRMQYGTQEGFWIDSHLTDRSENIDELQISPEELSAWLSESKSKWQPMTTTGASKLFRELQNETRPGVFAREGGLVAFVAPRGVRLADCEAPFRAFAVSSDLILGSTGAAAGGLILIARQRQLHFNTLPPLRFETFASMARNRATELAQSYERQRIFAGRVKDGDFQGWDWAPILLTSQLDDSEFGTLLNIADQILKSWSQHGEVEYFGFSYPKPLSYPFGRVPASGYFEEQFATSSLLFNWNTDGFATVNATTAGALLTPDRTGALSILYRPSGIFGRDDDLKSELVAKLYEEMNTEADEAAEVARDYFSGQGDPVLVRVVQNTLLYQSVVKYLRVIDPPAPSKAPRTDTVASVLQTEATKWLQRATGPMPDSSIAFEVRQEVAEFLARSHMTVASLAKFIASPQTVQQRLLREWRAYETNEARIDAIVEEVVGLEERKHLEFESACKTVGGAISSDPEGRVCKWKELGSSDFAVAAGKSPAFAQYNFLAGELASRDRAVKQLESEQTTHLNSIQTQEKVFTEAQALSKVLARYATGTDLDVILNAVLQATAKQTTAGPIRTPSIVLSKNRVETWAVGGHNISLVPQTRPVIKAPPISLTKPIPEPIRVISEAMPVKPRANSLLGEMRKFVLSGEENPARLQIAKEQARTCNCDALVTMHADGEITFVRNSPPPSSITLFGKSSVIDALGDPPRPRVIRFENFSPNSVEGIARSTELGSARPPTGKMEQAFADIGAAFRGDGEAESYTTISIERPGGQSEILKILDHKTGMPLPEPPAWPTGKTRVAQEEGWRATFGQQHTIAPDRQTAVIVQFGAKTDASSVLGVRIGVAESAKPGIGARLSAVVRSWLVRAPARSPLLDGIASLRKTIRQQLGAPEVDFFYKSNVNQIRVAQLKRDRSGRGE